jgi:hypothetical protein
MTDLNLHINAHGDVVLNTKRHADVKIPTISCELPAHESTEPQKRV